MRLRQLGDRARAVFQLPQHAATRDVGQRGEDEIELRIFKLNHLVQY